MESPQQSNSKYATYRMAWTAYIRPSIVFIITILIGLAFVRTSIWVTIIIILLGIIFFSLNIFATRAILLYTDKDGVWVYGGIFPWSKGISGIKWRDIEDATYIAGFKSWLFKSYKIRVGHRFTKTSEIILPHVARGSEAVMHINERHKEIICSIKDDA